MVITKIIKKGIPEEAINIVLSSQCLVQGFYEKNGYIPFGDVYYDEHCPHINMKKEL